MGLEDTANWALLGEGVACFASRTRELRSTLPRDFARLPGPIIVLAQRFDESPVGQFVSLSIGELVRIGLRFGYYFATSVVSVPDARRAGQQYWGFPHQLGKITWESKPGFRRIVWEDRGIEIEADVHGKPLPVLIPARTVQRRSDGPVLNPTSMRAMGRRAQVTIAVPDQDPLADLTGAHRGLALSGLVVKRGRARRPLGLMSSFHAPVRAPEPGVVTMGEVSFR